MTTAAARDILENLNKEQREAVEAVDGPVLIIAGPGSGKTRVITHRIAYLVRTLGVNPRRILAVTFTNRAAREMRSRVEGLIGDRSNQLTMGTFHAFGAGILRRDGEHIGVENDFVIYDQDDQLSLVKRAIETEGLDTHTYRPQAIQNAISGAKNLMLTVGDYAAQAGNRYEKIVTSCYDRYEQLLKAAHAVDFDDLLIKPVLLFRSKPEILAKYQGRYEHIVVDEWQDTNRAQYELTSQVAGKNPNLCVVGDPDQSIYAWRHADIENILRFERDFPKTQTISLGRNYRSTSTIVDAAHALVKANKDRKEIELTAEKGSGRPVTIEPTDDEEYEALYVAEEIERLVGEEKTRYGDCAIMYRTNAQSRAFEDAFNRAGIRYRIIGGLRFWERREIRDVVAYLRVLRNPFDDISLLRIVNVPTRGIGRRSLDLLQQWAEANNVPLYAAMQVAADGQEANALNLPTQSLGSVRAFVQMMTELLEALQGEDVLEFFDQVLSKTGYRDFLEADENAEDRLDNVEELRNVAAQYQALEAGDAFAAFLDQVALSTDLDAALRDEGSERLDAVTLITLHQAKGLEFPVAFIVGCEDELLPHIRSIESGDPAEMEEERRLCYVGMTRAMERLYMTYALRRNTRGHYGSRKASRFLQDLPDNLVKRRMPSPFGFSGPREPMPEPQLDVPKAPAPFRPGDHVGHARFGQGVVVACLETPTRDDFEVTVAFKGQGVKRLLAGLAGLEKLN